MIFIAISAILTILKYDIFSNWSNKVKRWFFSLVIYSFVLIILGLSQNNNTYYFFIDLESIVLILSGLIIGAIPTNWEFIKKSFYKGLAFAIVISLISLGDIDVITQRYGEKSTSLAYMTQYALWPSAFFILFWGKITNRKSKYIVMIAFSLCIIEQMIFQKRAPIIRFLVFASIAIYLSGYFLQNRNRFKKFFKLIVPALMVVLVIFTLNKMIGFNFKEVYGYLFFRFTSLSSVSSTSTQNGRFLVAMYLLDSLRGLDFWFGKGFGGTVIDPRFHWYVLVEGKFSRGASFLEIGHTWAILKGGIVFFIILNYRILKMLLSPRKFVPNWSDELRPYYFFVLISFIFLFLEGWFHSPNQLLGILFAASIGYLFSNKAIDNSGD